MTDKELDTNAQPQVEVEIKPESEKPFDLAQGKPKKKKSFLRSFLNLASYVVIILVIVLGLPKFLTWQLKTNYPMAAITSGSMWPVLKQGDLVFIKGVQNRDQIQVGDIIVFQNRANNTLTIHRVIKLEEKKITTKGDANFTEDAPVDYTDVIGETVIFRGKPLRIPFLGSVTVFASSLKQPKNDSGGK